MNDHEKAHDYDPELGAEANEVEILEVVGVDDDVPAPSASQVEEQAESDEVLFTVDADEETGPGQDGRVEAAEEAAGPVELPGAESELLARLRADYDNLRKRVAREREDFQLQANSQLIEGLLPVLDNFDRALGVEIKTGADGAFRAGMVMIYDQFSEALREQGLRRIETVGEPFDPNLHDAVATDPDSSAPANTIVEEYQRGYLFQNRLLRPALVRVSTNGRDFSSSGRNREGR